VPELDGLRALAIIAVVGFSYEPKHVPGGYLGATVFFVLTGYLITGVLTAEYRRRGTVDLKAFYARRVLRIYPPLVAVLLGTLVAATITGHPGIPARQIYEAAAATLVSLNDFLLGDGHFSAWLDPTWAVCIAIQFYLVWPLILVKALRTQPRQSVGLWCYVGAVAFAYLGYKLSSTVSFERTYFTPIGSIMPLLAGCAVALTRRQPTRHAMLEATWAAAIGAVLLVGLVVAGPVRGSLHSVSEAQPGATLAAAVLIFYLVEGPGVRLMRTRAIVWLGQCSYVIYLVHTVVLYTLLSASPGISSTDAALIGIPSTVALAGLSHRYLEAPFLRRKLRFSRLTPAPRPAAAPAAV
jgi:peptidoglycan/LPS O-acetylase OafA/YrhL